MTLHHEETTQASLGEQVMSRTSVPATRQNHDDHDPDHAHAFERREALRILARD
jgi:hypothetical protein